MTRRLPTFLFVFAVGLAYGSPAAAQGPSRAQVLVGMARNERVAGRPARAVALLREADAIQPFDTRTLDEYFWTAAEVGPRDAEPLGRRLLAIDPTMSRVRERLLEFARLAQDERRVVELAEEAARLDPRTALWPRRIGESRLRQGQPQEAAVAFARAAAAPDGVRGDAAQAALSLEAAGQMRQAYEAWRNIEPGVWQSNAAWTASRARTIAAIERTAVAKTTPARGATSRPTEPRVERVPYVSEAATAVDDGCSTGPLETLDRQEDPSALIDALLHRRAGCATEARWLDRGVERAVATGMHAPALAMLERRIGAGEPTIDQRELRGLLLAWTGEPARARPDLESVVAAAPGRAKAAETLADVRAQLIRLDQARARDSMGPIVELQRSGPGTATVSRALDNFDAQFGTDAAVMLELADRLSGYSDDVNDPIVAQLVGWTDRIAGRDGYAFAARLTKARLLGAVGSWDDALDAVNEALRESPGTPDAFKLRAELLSYAGQFAASVAAYDVYLSAAPEDERARRQQARVEGWRQHYGAARARYREVARLYPDDPAVRAEAAAKSAYYDERWRKAAAAYRTWLTLEPADPEARFELAGAYMQAGQFRNASQAFRSLLAVEPRHGQATESYARMRQRRATRASFLVLSQSADGYNAQRLLSEIDSLARVSGGVGEGSWLLAAGPSRVSDSTRGATGLRLNARFDAVLGPSWRVQTGLAAHAYPDLSSPFAGGDVALSWLPTDRLRLTAGVERTPVLDNLRTLDANIAAAGPRATIAYRRSSELSIDLTAGAARLTDGNQRADTRLMASQRVLRGRHELRVRVDVEGLLYDWQLAGGRPPDYFAPANFWKEQAGAVYRGWFRPLRYAGDRESWLEAAYLFGVDNQHVTYHSANVGLTHEFASGVSVTGGGTVTRSSVYNSAGATVSASLRPF